MGKKPFSLVVWGARIWLHTTAVLVIGVLIGLLVADLNTFKMFFGAIATGYFKPNWFSLAIHLLLSAATWGFCVYAMSLVRRRKRQAVKLHRARGSVMVETLIALVPFLLLTSGIAQYAMINVAGLLSDLAVYQAARTAWIWHPEISAGRNGVSMDDVKFRARTAAALSLAPSASADYIVGRNHAPGSGAPFRRIRTAVAASFNDVPVTGEAFWNITGQNWRFFEEDMHHASADNLTVVRAFDTRSFYLRAGRKVTAAWMAIEDFEVVEESGRVGARFTYQYTVLLPWFSYIFGGDDHIAMRDGRFIPITRKMTFRKQPGM